MIGLDTNILVRFLAADDPEQAKRAKAVFQSAVETGESLYISKIVLCELVWVLDRGYRFDRPALASVIDDLLRADHLVFEDREQVRRALDAFERGGAGFADFLILESCRAGGCEKILSFDAALAQSSDVVHL